MKYLMTVKDSDIHVEPDRIGVSMDGVRSLPAKARSWFEYDEYVTLEWDSVTEQMRVVHPMETAEIVQPLNVFRKYISSDDYSSGKTYQVSIYSDGVHTCDCPAWFFHPGDCKHIKAILDQNPYKTTTMWEILQSDDREKFREAQTRLYDKRPKESDEGATQDAPELSGEDGSRETW